MVRLEREDWRCKTDQVWWELRRNGGEFAMRLWWPLARVTKEVLQRARMANEGVRRACKELGSEAWK